MKFATQIHSERLLLRVPRKRDLWFFWKLISDEQVRRYLGGPVVWSERLPRFKRYLSAPEDVGVWMVRLRETNQPIGLVELGPHKDGNAYEISYQFLPAYWGKGLASEAARAVVSHALDQVGLDRVIAETQSANSTSCRLLIGQGMIESERLHRFGAEQTIFTTK